MTLWLSPWLSRISIGAATLLLLPPTLTGGALDSRIQQALAKKYPGEQVAASCGGSFLDRPHHAAVVLHRPSTKHFRVLWAAPDGRVQELQSIAEFGAVSELELKCLDRKQAQQLKETLQHSEAIRDFLHVPAGRGALCYFVEPTQAACWTTDASGRLITAGGWET